MKNLLILFSLIFIFSCGNDTVVNNNGGNPAADFDIYLLNLNSNMTGFETSTIKSDGTGIKLFNDSLAVCTTSKQNKILLAKLDSSFFSYSAIYAANFDGTNIVNIPKGNYHPLYLDLSPNSEKGLFTTDIGNFMCVFNTDGSGLVQLSDGIRGTETVPKFSPDGKLIAYFEAPANLQTSLFITSTDGTYKKQLKDSIFYDNGFTLDWSPDGSKIVYQNRKGNLNESKICIIDTSGNFYTQIAVGINPAWSPNGNKICYLVNVNQGIFDLYLMNTDGSGIINISNTASMYEGIGAWSRDGSKILYSSQDLTNKPIIYIYDISSGQSNILVDSVYGAIWK